MNLINEIINNKYLLLDGGLATTLELNGYILDNKLWSAWNIITDINSIINIHKEYYNIGCNIITTSSYQMSYEGFYEKGYNNNENEIDKIFQKSTDCAIIARNQIYLENNNNNNSNNSNINRFIATSIGCYGAHLADGSEYRGNYGLSSNDIQKWHTKKFSILANSGIDLIACETIPCVAEAQALVQLISQQCNTNEKISQGWISFACNSGNTLNSNENIEDAIRYLIDPSYDNDIKTISSWGIGINCTNPLYINDLLDIIRDTGAMSGYRPIVIYPNKGEIWNANERSWNESSGYDDILFAESSLEWYNNGANILGGCCRTTPQTISCIKTIFDSNSKNK